MKADKFLKLFYQVDYLHLSLFYPGAYQEPLYNPLFNLACLIAPKENSNTGQLVKFHQLLENYKSNDDVIICLCYPIKGTTIDWDKPLYVPLEELEVCECNSEAIDRVINNFGY